jgi:hypothetical protein
LQPEKQLHSRSIQEMITTQHLHDHEIVMNTLSRRGFFHFGVQGLAATAFLDLCQQSSGAPKTHHAAKAKRIVQISLVGGLSHLDSFDYKPALSKAHGKTLETTQKPDLFFGQMGLLRKPDWEFRPHGKAGLWISDLFPEIARCADDLTIINSMVADSANHTPALFMLNSGFQLNGYPALGSWLSYGLGSETEELPAFVVLPDRRGEANGAASNCIKGSCFGQVPPQCGTCSRNKQFNRPKSRPPEPCCNS